MKYGELTVYFNDSLTVRDFISMVEDVCDELDWDSGDEGSWPMWDKDYAEWEEIPADEWSDIKRRLQKYKGITVTYVIYREEEDDPDGITDRKESGGKGHAVVREVLRGLPTAQDKEERPADMHEVEQDSRGHREDNARVSVG